MRTRPYPKRSWKWPRPSTARPFTCRPQEALDVSAGRAIGQAYLAANPSMDPATLRATLLPTGFDAGARARLRALVAADFRAARVFVFKGWRLSETEARLFALLA